MNFPCHNPLETVSHSHRGRGVEPRRASVYAARRLILEPCRVSDASSYPLLAGVSGAAFAANVVLRLGAATRRGVSARKMDILHCASAAAFESYQFGVFGLVVEAGDFAQFAIDLIDMGAGDDAACGVVVLPLPLREHFRCALTRAFNDPYGRFLSPYWRMMNVVHGAPVFQTPSAVNMGEVF